MSFNLNDYVDVAERIRQFYELYPEGSLQTIEWRVVPVSGMAKDKSTGEYKLVEKTFITYHAKAYRSKDDPHPAHGIAWEVFPGTTPYTRDSELMNAETSAWGRAAVAAGLPTKKIASTEEVKAREPEQSFADKMRTTKLPANELKVLIAARWDDYDGRELDKLKGEKFAAFLDAMSTDRQEILYALANEQ